MPMEVSPAFEPKRREALRAWFQKNHATEKQVWILYPRPERDDGTITYLDIVEEALCFGWIDSTLKRHDEVNVAQRLSPRSKKSNWTELNKERARRMIALGLMTDAGRAVLPDLSLGGFVLPAEVARALAAVPGAKQKFDALPEVYRRIRVAHAVDPKATPEARKSRLDKLVAASKKGETIGNWDDSEFRVTRPRS